MKSAFPVLVASFIGLSAPGFVHAQSTDIGAELYTQYCATCHGSNGKGGGDLASLLTVTPPNLTKIAAENDGEFPLLKVIHIIDGRTGVRAHGGPMPLYGAIFSHAGDAAPGDYGSVIEARGRLLSLALYLESIQEK